MPKWRAKREKHLGYLQSGASWLPPPQRPCERITMEDGRICLHAAPLDEGTSCYAIRPKALSIRRSCRLRETGARRPSRRGVSGHPVTAPYATRPERESLEFNKTPSYVSFYSSAAQPRIDVCFRRRRACECHPLYPEATEGAVCLEWRVGR